MQPLCHRTQAWAHRLLYDDAGSARPPADLYSHVMSCPVCHGSLTLIVLEVLPDAARTQEAALPYRDSHEDLAAFVDLEAEAGSLLAIETFPHVWLDLIHVPDMAESYRWLRTMLAQE